MSELIHESGKVAEFQDAISNSGKELSEIENEFVGYSCSKITANIFKHWKLSHNLIFSIGFVGDVNNCPEEFKQKAQILEVIKILADITAPLSEKNIAKALKKAKEYDLDTSLLSKAIERIQDKIGEEV